MRFVTPSEFVVAISLHLEGNDTVYAWVNDDPEDIRVADGVDARNFLELCNFISESEKEAFYQGEVASATILEDVCEHAFQPEENGSLVVATLVIDPKSGKTRVYVGDNDYNYSLPYDMITLSIPVRMRYCKKLILDNPYTCFLPTHWQYEDEITPRLISPNLRQELFSISDISSAHVGHSKCEELEVNGEHYLYLTGNAIHPDFLYRLSLDKSVNQRQRIYEPCLITEFMV